MDRPTDPNDESRWWGTANASTSTPRQDSRKPSVRWHPSYHPESLPAPATHDAKSSLISSVAAFFNPAPTSRRSRSESLSRQAIQKGQQQQSTAAALLSPAMLRFILLCALWYMSSAFSSTTGKQIMHQFRYPVTLTFVQFGFVSGYCLVFANPWCGWTRIRSPTVPILRNTLPMAVFQVGGHIFSSMAISRVPVSTVHTIKALSPLFTVAAYALIFGVRYSAKTYVSLLPLTFGVMLACSFDLNLNNALGLICAFGSAIVFVTSNIFFKKIMPSQPAGAPAATPAHKLDKLNLLFYSSGLAFLLMIPLWLWSDLGRLLDHDHHPTHYTGNAPAPPHGVLYYFFLNGTVHWAQNIIAFAILSSTSPVTYSIASLIKRIAVILIAIAWFGQTVHLIQGLGIGLTFVGLWMYNNAKADVERGETRMRRAEARMSLSLPMTKGDARMMMETPIPSPQPSETEWDKSGMLSYSITSAVEQQPGSTFVNAAALPTPHNRTPSLVPVNLVAAGGPVTSPSLPSAHPGFSHPQAPPRLDTAAIHAKHAHREHQPMSPTESYPSPPASTDSPPQTAIPAFPVPGSIPPPKVGAGGMFNRRPTVYESSSFSGGLSALLNPHPEETPASEGLPNGVPVVV